MKRFHLFVGRPQEFNAGLGDYVASFETAEEAKAAADVGDDRDTLGYRLYTWAVILGHAADGALVEVADAIRNGSGSVNKSAWKWEDAAP